MQLRGTDAMKCDFCSDPNPTWSYPCKTFDTMLGGLPIFKSLGAFEVCDRCHDLIEANDWRAMEERAIHGAVPPEEWKAASLIDQAAYRILLRQWFLIMGENRTGPATRIQL
jgi:hypothetical protein